MDFETADNKNIRDRLFVQMQKYENKEVTGNEYEKDFRESYIPICKKIYFLTRLIYSMSPVKVNDPAEKTKVKGLLDNLKKIRQEISDAFRPMIDKLNERATNPEIQRRLEIYQQAVKSLMDMVDHTKNKLRA